MEVFGVLALIILIFHSAYPRKVKKLESNVKILRRKQGGVDGMSKIISELVGQSCKIKTNDPVLFEESAKLQCTVLAADDEWIKLAYTDKKKIAKTKILRIDSIENIELINEQGGLFK